MFDTMMSPDQGIPHTSSPLKERMRLWTII